jgi:hypothetical protein
MLLTLIYLVYKNNFNYLYKINYFFYTIKKKTENRMRQVSKCGSGHSPTGNCIGWYSLTEEEYKKARAL